MSSEPLSDQPSTPLAAPAAAPVGATAAGPATSPTPSRTSAGRGSAVTLLLGAVAAAALVSSGLLWQKLSAIQEQLARQSADAGAQAIEALTMARLGTYDCILADIRLSDIGGYEIYCRIKQTQPQAKVILMSSYGYDPTHAIVKARQDGLQHILFKPFRVDQLLDALTCSPKVQRNPKLGA